jgi:Domain of Unknown Function (DUF748)
VAIGKVRLNPYEFVATTEVVERLTWRGRLSAAPLGSPGEFTLGGIKLAKYAPYCRDLVRFDLAGGSLDVGGRYDVDLSGATPRATLAGRQVHFTGLKIAPRGTTTPVVELDDLSVTGIDADACPRMTGLFRRPLIQYLGTRLCGLPR